MCRKGSVYSTLPIEVDSWLKSLCKDVFLDSGADMSYPDFINKLKLYTKSIAQKEPEQIETDYLGEDIESYLNGKLNPPKEAVAALEHVYAFSRSQSMESRSHTDYYELYFKQRDSEFGLYEENVLPEYNKLQIGKKR